MQMTIRWFGAEKDTVLNDPPKMVYRSTITTIHKNQISVTLEINIIKMYNIAIKHKECYI